MPQKQPAAKVAFSSAGMAVQTSAAQGSGSVALTECARSRSVAVHRSFAVVCDVSGLCQASECECLFVAPPSLACCWHAVAEQAESMG